MFKAIILRRDESSITQARLESISSDELPQGEIQIDVAYSTLNYKDALAVTGKAPVVRQWPMIPGIDLAGVITNSSDDRYSPGQAVVVNGHGMGEVRWGGLAQKASVSADWITPLPDGLSMADAMSIGTAGYTAMLSVLALERNGITPESGPILVTGANGGVGGFALALLSKRGYDVVASTGRVNETAGLLALGAREVIARETLSEKGKPLQKEQWAGAVDCVGSHTLANICAQMRYGGVVTACGLAQGMDFPATVAPFILRGVTLVGIDSVYAPESLRNQAWQCLAKETNAPMREQIATTVLTLAQSIDAAHDLLAGRIKGRLMVNVNA